nr:splicing factor [Tanacetum cinerariifolium]
MKCVCNMWQLSGIPSVHDMAGYMHMKMNLYSRVDECMPPPTATPSTSNTMLPPPTPSPSTSNTMPPQSGSNTMPPPPTPSSSNTMPSHAASASIGTNKGKEFDHVEEHRAPDVAAGKQPMIEYEPLQVGVDLPTHESIVEANPKPTRSKKSKAAEVPNQMRIFHKNRGTSKRIFNQKMKIFKFDKHGTGSTPDKAFDV